MINIKQMRFLFLIFLGTFFLYFSSCTSDSTHTENPPVAEATTDNPKKKKIKRAPVEIYPSTERDYPEALLALDFPINPAVEVHNVGNTLLDNGGIFLTLRSRDELKKLEDTYRKDLRALGWMEGKINIFQGADSATMFEKDNIVCRLIIIDEEDYRKVAVNVTPKPKVEDF